MSLSPAEEAAAMEAARQIVEQCETSNLYCEGDDEVIVARALLSFAVPAHRMGTAADIGCYEYTCQHGRGDPPMDCIYPDCPCGGLRIKPEYRVSLASSADAIRAEVIEECAKAVEGMRPCPFDKGQPDPGLSPDDPCPVCGDFGTIAASDEPSKCQSPAATIRALKALNPTK